MLLKIINREQFLVETKNQETILSDILPLKSIAIKKYNDVDLRL